MDCVFCNIIANKVPSNIEYQDEDCIVIADILPKAPVHMLVIPKKHFTSLAEILPEDSAILGKLLYTAKKIAEDKGISESGYRVNINVGKNGGQIVPHLHVHVLGGRELGE